MKIAGLAENGLMKGAYYVEMFSDKFREKLGFVPYPGTLNIRLVWRGDMDTRKRLNTKKHILIEPFEKDGKSFVDVKCYPCTINGKTKGAIVIPGKTDHPPEVIEIIAKDNLRETLSIKDNDCVVVELD